MTKRRLLCCLLALLVLIGLLPVFAACAKDGEIYTGFFKKTVELEDFTIVYGEVSNTDTVSASFKGMVNQFAKDIQKSTGVLLPVNSDQTTTTGARDPEILIGHTNRDESRSLLKSIKGHGFAISVKRNKITIVGSNAIMTLYALDYFTDNYLCEGNDNGTVRSPRRIKANNVETILLASNANAEYTWVYEDGLDTDQGSEWGGSNAADYDYPYQGLLTTVQQMMKLTNLPDRFFKIKTDTAAANDKEVLIGRPNREEVQTCLAQMPGDGYGLFTVNERVIVTAWSDSGLSASIKLFQELLRDATIEGENGYKEFVFPKGMSLVANMTGSWVTDFPKPEGVSLYSSQDAGNDAFQYLYKGASAEKYNDYYNKLLSAGYTVLTENEIEESLFSTLVNEEKGHVINLTYNAYKHGKGNYKYEPMLRVISTPIASANLPDTSLLSASAYDKLVDSSITTMRLESSSAGMCYVILLEDGRFVIFDGGLDNGQVDRLHDILISLHIKATGKEPAADNPIRIAAWFITHSEDRHYGVFSSFLLKYMSLGYVKMEYLMGNYPSMMATYNASETDNMMTNMAHFLGPHYGDFSFVKIHTGQVYHLANLEIEVLCTQEDILPQRINHFNDTSSTVRFKMTATDAEGNAVENKEATVTSVWTGDTFIYGSRFMSAMYGTYLKSDMVQVANHGEQGAESHFYANVAPTVVWFPNSTWAYRSLSSKTSDVWYREANYHLIHELGTVQYVYVSDSKNTTLVLTASGPDYDGIYDPTTGEQLRYNTNNRGYANKFDISQ